MNRLQKKNGFLTAGVYYLLAFIVSLIATLKFWADLSPILIPIGILLVLLAVASIFCLNKHFRGIAIQQDIDFLIMDVGGTQEVGFDYAYTTDDNKKLIGVTIHGKSYPVESPDKSYQVSQSHPSKDITVYFYKFAKDQPISPIVVHDSTLVPELGGVRVFVRPPVGP